MSTQEAAVQCCHWYEKVGAPVHAPGFPVNRCPGSSAPVIVGRTVLTGASSERTLTGIETATARPAVFDPATAKRSVLPRSSVVSVYVLLPIEPEMEMQFRPEPSHRSQLSTKSIHVPVHVPRAPVRVSPTAARPVTVGAAVLAGAISRSSVKVRVWSASGIEKCTGASIRWYGTGASMCTTL